MLFGAHVSIAGGLINAPKNAADLGCEVFQMFTRSPQGGFVAPLDENIAKEFKSACKEFGQKEWYVHTPYFINFASANPRIKHASIAVVREELERASLLGAKYLMTHLGSFASLGKEKGFPQLIKSLDEMLSGYKGKTKFLIEISAGAGEIIGGNFESIAEVINHPKLIKYDIDVCFDTQHAFASGYDLRDASAVKITFDTFDKIIGLDKLKISHCNDSKTDCNSHSDHHAHIGQGKIGIEGFRALIADKRLTKVNFILETKPDAVKEDLEMLKKLRLSF
ncbi:MAG: deoxyribonuclease IV [Patescibacteria group bacterium]